MRDKTANYNYIVEKITDSKYKVTNQRCEIVKAMCENKKHMTSYDIYKKVKHKSIGLSTIYRTLDILENIGVLSKIDKCNIKYYELQTMEQIHIHIRCSKCNKLMDIKEKLLSKDIKDVVMSIERKHKIEVNNIDVMLSGICKSCIKQ